MRNHMGLKWLQCLILSVFLFQPGISQAIENSPAQKLRTYNHDAFILETSIEQNIDFATQKENAYRSDRFLIKLKTEENNESSTTSYVFEQITNQIEVKEIIPLFQTLTSELPQKDLQNIYVLKVPMYSDIPYLIEKIRNQVEVEQIQPDFYYRVSKEFSISEESKKYVTSSDISQSIINALNHKISLNQRSWGCISATCPEDSILNQLLTFTNIPQFSNNEPVVLADVENNLIGTMQIEGVVKKLTTGINDEIQPILGGQNIIWKKVLTQLFNDITLYNTETEGTEILFGGNTFIESFIGGSISGNNLAYVATVEDIDPITDEIIDDRPIILHNLQDHTERRLVNGFNFKSNPNILNDHIVWYESNDDLQPGVGNWEVILYDLINDSRRNISADQFDQFDPTTYGDLVVWEDRRFGNSDIFLYHISTNFLEQITTNEANQIKPVIFGNKIAWYDSRHGNWSIYLYDIDQKTETRITGDSNVLDPVTPVSFYGNKLVWADKLTTKWDIHLYNTSTREEELITNSISDQINPKIFNNKIVWQDKTFGNWDIVLLTIPDGGGVPVIEAPGTILARFGEPIEFSVVAQDSDAINNLTFLKPLAEDLPEGATFEITFNEPGHIEGRFFWEPNANQLDDFFIPFAVTDGENDVSVITKISVSEGLINNSLQIVSPVPGSVLNSSTVIFQWNAIPNAATYFLGVGTSFEEISHFPWGDIYGENQSLNLTAEVTGIPLNGNDIFVRFWANVSGVWFFKDFNYTTENQGGGEDPLAADLIAPSIGSVLKSSSVTFEWTQGVGISEIFLGVGTNLDALTNEPFGDIFSGSVEGVTKIIDNIPLTGSPIFVRLWSRINGLWQTKDYTFQTSNGVSNLAEIISPQPEFFISSTNVVFEWSDGIDVTEYWLGVGTSFQSISTNPWGNIFAGAVTGNLKEIAGIPLNGKPIFVRMWSKINGKWQSIDYEFQTEDLGVGGKEAAEIISPLPGTILSDTTAIFQWNQGSNVTEYWLGVGTSLESISNKPWGDIFAGSVTGNSKEINGIPLKGNSIFVRMWSKIDGVWESIDYEFQTEDLGIGGKEPAALINPQVGTPLNQTTVTFQWNNGFSVTEYYLGVGTSLQSISTKPWGNIFAGTVIGNSQEISGIPLNGKSIFARMWSKIDGKWQSIDYEFQTEDLGIGGKEPANLINPQPNTTINQSTLTFQWDTGSGVTEYWLGVGTSFQSVSTKPWGNIFAKAVNGTSQVVSGIPLNGNSVFVRLWSKIDGKWETVDYTFATEDQGGGSITEPEIIAPTAASTIDQTEVIFRWSAGVGVTEYYLGVGTTQNSISASPWGNIFSKSVGLAQEAAVTGIPLNGNLIFVRLWFKVNGIWQSKDYTYATVNNSGGSSGESAQLIAPASGSAILSSTVTFEWTSGDGTEYYLGVGTTQNSISKAPWGNVFSKNVGTVTSVEVTNIPLNVPTIFVRLWTKVAGQWTYIDYSFPTSQ